jgi:hypothetical protein
MKETIKTACFCLAAILLAVAAAGIEPGRATPDVFSDQGEAFFPDFTDVLACKSLEVIDYEEATATARPFKVEFKDKRWVLPSHHNYPADAQDRLAKTAASMVDLKKEMIRSDSAADHAAFGVVDPLDPGAAGLSGRGKRVTLKGEDGKTLADYILGKPVEDKPGYRHLRVPGQKRTYAARTDADPSIRFEDWIETDLLRLSADDVRKVTIHSYTLNEQLGQLENLERTILTKEEGKWRIAAGGVARQATVDALLEALAKLRIVDVQPKPLALTQDLKKIEGIQLSLESVLSLRGRGFLITPTGQLISNSGEIIVETALGLVYNLRFGEVAAGEPVSLETAGPEEDGKQHHERRYLFITVRYDEERALQYNHGDASRVADRGQRLARQLTNRFADWYYVISGADFNKLRPRMRQLTRR